MISATSDYWSTTMSVLVDGKPWWFTRFFKYKREADRYANWQKHNGGKYVSVKGNRGGPWRVRCRTQWMMSGSETV